MLGRGEAGKVSLHTAICTLTTCRGDFDEEYMSSSSELSLLHSDDPPDLNAVADTSGDENGVRSEADGGFGSGVGDDGWLDSEPEEGFMSGCDCVKRQQWCNGARIFLFLTFHRHLRSILPRYSTPSSYNRQRIQICSSLKLPDSLSPPTGNAR